MHDVIVTTVDTTLPAHRGVVETVVCGPFRRRWVAAIVGWAATGSPRGSIHRRLEIRTRP